MYGYYARKTQILSCRLYWMSKNLTLLYQDTYLQIRFCYTLDEDCFKTVLLQYITANAETHPTMSWNFRCTARVPESYGYCVVVNSWRYLCDREDKTMEEHNCRLKILQQSNLRVKLTECKFTQKSMKYLGHWFVAEGLDPLQLTPSCKSHPRCPKTLEHAHMLSHFCASIV